MKYPKFIASGSTIGICAPSFGCAYDPYKSRYDCAKKNFNYFGFNIVETASVYKLKKAQSTTPSKRVQEFMSVYDNNDVDFVLAISGGELMCDIIPLIDFEKIKRLTPKWFMGFSDNTFLTFLLPTICDIASIYGYCASNFGMEKLDKSLTNAIQVMQGNTNNQYSFKKYQVNENKEVPLASFNLTNKVVYEILTKEEKVSIEGRIIGGCLDVLVAICGTKFDHVKDFNERYKDDGIIWYLEACELTSIHVKRALWQLNNAGWFKNVRGFIIGRPMTPIEPFDVTHQDAVLSELKRYNVPIVYGCDIGHLPPSWTIINGSYAKFQSSKGTGSISFKLI